MIAELASILIAGGGVGGGGLFLSRWVDSVNESLKDLAKGQGDLRVAQENLRLGQEILRSEEVERHSKLDIQLDRMEARLPNGELKQLLDDVQLLKKHLVDK